MKLIIPENSDFSIDNIPFGIFSTPERTPRAGAAIGEYIIDLFELTNDGLKVDFDRSVFLDPALNRFIALGKNITVDFRIDIQKWLKQSLWSDKDFNRFFVPQESANMHLPVQIGDYTDFYASIEHATNVGMMFRDPENALLTNWRHLPVAYHGRASSIIPSGVNIHRPKGQTMPNGAEKPVYGPSRLLDFELETAFIIGRNSDLGQQISTGEAASYIFGMVLFNDWSARDIQKWEYVPLGPFLGKNFASSISPWIVTMEALEPFRTDTPKQEPEVLPYLQFEGQNSYDIELQVSIQAENEEESLVCRSNFKYMYWNMCQQLAHHTVNGCNVRIGDMMGSGTLSGPDESAFGSMLELSWGGKKTVALNNGLQRKFIEDNDTVIMRGFSQNGNLRVGFGDLKTKVLPAL